MAHVTSDPAGASSLLLERSGGACRIAAIQGGTTGPKKTTEA